MDLSRVVVLGCSGSGKSTLARELARRTGLPLVHLDQEYWSPGWKERYDAAQWQARIIELSQREQWVMDGNFSDTLAIRLERATAALWIDVPRWFCLYSIGRRLLASYGRVRPDMAPGCPEHWDAEFVRYIWHWHRRSRPRVAAMLAAPGQAGRALRFRTRRAAWDWLDGRLPLTQA
jgi:adenylate kinase family enzyme